MSRVAICGTHGIGKTTLADKLSQELGLPILKEEATSLLKTEFPFHKTEQDFEVFKEFQTRVLENQLNSEFDNWKSGFVADRAILDSLAYVHVRTVMERDFGSFLNSYADRVWNGIVNRYDKLIFIRYDDYFTNSDASIRNLNPVFMKEIDRFIDYYLLKSPVNFDVLELRTLDFEKRVKMSLNFIRGE